MTSINKINSIEQQEIDSFAEATLLEKKYCENLPILLEYAKNGHVGAAIALAQIYFNGGKGVCINYEAAKYWLEFSISEVETSYALHQLGIIYTRGLDVLPDHKVAYKYFRRASLLGNALSLLMVGVMQLDNDGVTGKEMSGKIILKHCIWNKDLRLSHRFLSILCIYTPKTSFLHSKITSIAKKGPD